MATNLGDLSVTLQLDIRPYAEGIKSALAIGKQFEAQSKNLFSKGINIDTSKIDNELKKLQNTLTKLPSGFSSAGSEAGKFDKEIKNISVNTPKANKSLLESVQQISIAGYGLSGIASMALREVKELIDAANKFQNAMLGLQSVAKFKGIDPDAATNSIKNLDIVKSGLISVTDAGTALKNLLSTGFSLEESIELMKRFGDAAAFNRQSSLTFGYAIASATEGIKNGNSVLVDNAGVTKNLSLILQEAGFSAQDLMKVTTDLNVREALYNGLLKETNAQLGDAAKLTNTFAGKQEQLNSKINYLKIAAGEGLQKGLLNVVEGMEKIAAASGKAGQGFNMFATIISETMQFTVSPALYVWGKLSDIFAGIPNLVRRIIDEFTDGIPVIDVMLDKIDRFIKKRKSATQGTPDQEVGYEDTYATDEYGNLIPPPDRTPFRNAKEIDDSAEGGVRSTNKKSPNRKTKNIKDAEELNRLKLIDEEIKKLRLALASNTEELGSYSDILSEINELEKKRRHLTGEDLKDIKSKTAELDTQRDSIEEIINTLDEKNELFESIVEMSKQRVIDSGEFQTAKILFSDIADVLQNKLGDAWEAVFGKADNLAEIFLQSLTQKFLDMALQFAVTSILSSIFPGAGLIASFFGGGGGTSPAGLISGGGGAISGRTLGNTIEGFLQRAPIIKNFENRSTQIREVPYISSLETDNKKIWVSLRHAEKSINKMKS